MEVLRNIIITFVTTTTVYMGGYAVVNNDSFVDVSKAFSEYLVNAATLKEDPSDNIYEFIECINAKDLNTAVTYIDPKYEKAYNATSNILEKVIGFNIKDFFDIAPVLLDFVKAENGSLPGDFKININDVKKKYADKKDAVYYVKYTTEVTNEKGHVSKEIDSYDMKMHKYPKVGWRLVVSE